MSKKEKRSYMKEENRPFWKGKPVLVTGAAGFIGSHLCERLAQVGAKVRAFVRYNSMNSFGRLEDVDEKVREKIEIYTGEILDEASVFGAMKDMDTVFHMAALPSIPYSLMNPSHVFSVNMNGSRNVLLSARSCGTKKVVLASSGGASEKRPLLSPYITSKAAMERIGLGFHQGFGMNVTTLRLLNNYGPRQSARAVIPTIINQALVKNQVNLGALEPAMDFNFVGDTVEAFFRVAERDESAGRILTWGSGKSTSIGDLANLIFSIIGREGLRVVRDEQRVRPYRGPAASLQEEMVVTYEVLGYTPKVSLEEGLKITIDWISRHLDLYKPELYAV
ncbi:MAG: SDR family NAD(P)-dependent oxidoreductase [Candidatus Aminicenantales bacterium]